MPSSFSILHSNDFHGTLTEEKAKLISEYKEAYQPCFYFDTGDCIKTGNLGIPRKEEKVWELLARAGCDAGVLGNRETHLLKSAFETKIQGHRHPLLCANLRYRDGRRPLPQSVILESDNIKVGIFGLMVPMVTEKMIAKAASAFLWDSPIPVAKSIVPQLRANVDCLIALTHIGLRADLKLAEACPEIDIVLGGHSHSVLQEPLRVGSTALCQGGSHGRFLGRYTWSSEGGLSGGLVPLSSPNLVSP